MSVADLPHLNAALNAAAAALLCAGFAMIRQKKIAAHKACMLSAFCVSTAFLASYLYYHLHHGATRFPAEFVWARRIYLTILLTHTILAVAIVPMVLLTLWRAFKQSFDRHRAIARWTLPLWLYVSVTGVVIYGMLYHLYPAR